MYMLMTIGTDINTQHIDGHLWICTYMFSGIHKQFVCFILIAKTVVPAPRGWQTAYALCTDVWLCQD